MKMSLPSGGLLDSGVDGSAGTDLTTEEKASSRRLGQEVSEEVNVWVRLAR